MTALLIASLIVLTAGSTPLPARPASTCGGTPQLVKGLVDKAAGRLP